MGRFFTPVGLRRIPAQNDIGGAAESISRQPAGVESKVPTNLPPHYYVAERKYREARGPAEKVAALQEMLSATPKHKGTDHLRADLRSKVSRTMEELERPKSGSRQAQPYAIRKEGVGQAALIGLPNAGRSQLLASLTGASAKVAAYPFTTQIPLPGMLLYENVRIQIVDTPALTDRDVQTRLFSLLRNADLLLMVVDLSIDPLAETDELLEEMDRWGYRIMGPDEEPDPEDHRVQKRGILVGNKADVEDAEVALEFLEELHGDKFPVLGVSAVTGQGLAGLTEAIYSSMGMIRIYLKPPGGPPDYDAPVVVGKGDTLESAAQSLHKDWARKLKFAMLWGSGKFDGQRVGRDYILSEGDVIELHG